MNRNNNIELAKLDNGEYVYGTYNEVEAYADINNTVVDRYLDHVNPSTANTHFKWVGKGLSDPYAVSVPFDYRQSRTKGNFNARGVDQDKF